MKTFIYRIRAKKNAKDVVFLAHVSNAKNAGHALDKISDAVGFTVSPQNAVQLSEHDLKR